MFVDVIFSWTDHLTNWIAKTSYIATLDLQSSWFLSGEVCGDVLHVAISCGFPVALEGWAPYFPTFFWRQRLDVLDQRRNEPVKVQEIWWYLVEGKRRRKLTMDTPQKSSIDTKNGHILKESTFSKPSFWVSMLLFGGRTQNCMMPYFNGSLFNFGGGRVWSGEFQMAFSFVRIAHGWNLASL